MNKVIIDKQDLVHNIKKIKEHSKINSPDDNGNPVKIIVVIKANAYGLDLKQYTQFMIDQGFDFFAVSTVEEALEFRNLGFKQKLLMLSSTAIKEEIEELVQNDIIITIGSRESANIVNEIAKEQNKKIKAHVKIDTGFGRYGFIYSNRDEMIETIKSLDDNIKIEGTFTHFSNAFYDDKYTKLQFKRFIDCIEVLKMNNIETGILHVCNSSAFIKFPHMHLNAVRIGSAFTGRLSFQNNLGLKRIAKLESQVTEIKTLPSKFNIGYSNIYKTKKETKIAIIPSGYINGINIELGQDTFRPIDKLRTIVRATKNAFKKQELYVDIAEQKCKILGRIGTFHVIADITGKDIKIGDKAKFNINNILVNPNIQREYI